MHTTYFEQYWSFSGVPQIVDGDAVHLSISYIFGICPRLCPMCPMMMGSSPYCVMMAAHDGIRGATHHYRTHWQMDDGISQKLNLWMEAQHFHQQF
jgi:hypothetical protein